MAKIIPFPKETLTTLTPYEEAFLEAQQEIESRFNMPLATYMKFEGDPEERDRKVQRVLKKEMLQLQTRLAYEE